MADNEKQEPVLRDIHNSPMWKKAYSQEGTFQGDPQAFVLMV